MKKYPLIEMCDRMTMKTLTTRDGRESWVACLMDWIRQHEQYWEKIRKRA